MLAMNLPENSNLGSRTGLITSLGSKWKLLTLIAAAILLRILFAVYSGYAQEDAFITFRFARNLADGLGFAYNPHEPIYGSTTPLLTLMLALWLRLARDPLLGARLIGLISAALYLFFSARSVEALGGSRVQALFAIGLLALNTRLMRQDISGMEMPIVLALMASSLDMTLRRRYTAAAVLCGLCLWTRLDTLPWVALLLVYTWFNDRVASLRMALIATATYLPWLLYAEVIFGSPIPHTIYAKWVAYPHSPNIPADLSGPLPLRIFEIIRPFLVFPREASPFEIRRILPLLHDVLAVSAWLLILRALPRLVRTNRTWLLAGWVGFEFLKLGLTQATFFERYLVPGIWGVMILLGWSLGELWELFKSVRWRRFLSIGILFAGLALIAVGSAATTRRFRDLQRYRYDGSLKPIGLWLRENTPPGTTVQLEPLGYVGYYSERIMLDEVGLVTPSVVKMKQEGISSAEVYTQVLRPDAFVIHCDDASRISLGEGEAEQWVQEHYQPVKVFDPLDFRLAISLDKKTSNLARVSCYEIWLRTR